MAILLWNVTPPDAGRIQYFILAIFTLCLAVADAIREDPLHVAAPMEFGILVLHGIPAAAIVHAMVLVVRLGMSRVVPTIRSVSDELTRTVISVGVAAVILAEGWGIAGTVLSAALYICVTEGMTLLDSVRRAHIEMHIALMLVAAETSSALLLVVLYPRLLTWGAVLVVVVLAVVKYSADLLFKVRRAYQAMLEATVAAIEMGDTSSEGHGLRVSKIAGNVGRQLGYRGHRLETLSQAALLHELTVSHPHQLENAQLERVRYLQDVLPVLRALQGAADGIKPWQAEMAYIVHRAAVVDAAGSRIRRGCIAQNFVHHSAVDSSVVHSVDAALRTVLVRER